jgi:PKD repeat protein
MRLLAALVGLTWLALAAACGRVVMEPSQPDHQADLRLRLQSDLARLGKDIAHVPAKAPTQGNEVFDLVAVPAAGGYRLTWTEKLVGDYDLNGLVNIGELTPLGARRQTFVEYDDPLLHGGIAWWPAGDPEQDNGADPFTPPAAGSGAFNWLLARIDGDSNGQCNIGDVTPIAAHWGERLDGYRIYRKEPGGQTFTILTDPQNPGEPLLVERSDAGPRAGQTGISPLRPVRYEFVDTTATGTGYEYKVAPFDASSGEEGPLSIAGTSPIVATVSATPQVGAAPLAVQFDAGASSSPSGPIVSYSWDFENDGIIDILESASPLASHTYTLNGRYLAVVTLRDSDGNTAAVGKAISVTTPPVARLRALPGDGEIPVTIRFDASQSSDVDGQVVMYEWDLDGDNSFETNTGPVSYRELSFDATGSVAVGLRVTDNLGATDTTQLSLPLVDNYDEREPNDSPLQPTLLGTFDPGQAIAGVRGSVGAGSYDGDDTDWYSVEVTTGGVLTVDLAFLHSAADLSLRLYSANGATEEAASLGSLDNEQLEHGIKGAGNYLLLVERSVASVGQQADYQLSLSFAAITYTETEDNDSRTSATPLGPLANPNLPVAWGNLGPGGLDGDSIDWYRVELPQAAQLTTQLCFRHKDADLDLAVFGGAGSTLMGESLSIDDNEEVTFNAAAGTYFIRCTRHEGGNANYILGFILQ